MKLRGTHLFTPRDDRTGTRPQMQVSNEDRAKIVRGPWEDTFTDLNTGRRYRVKGAACSIPACYCDAVIVCELS